MLSDISYIYLKINNMEKRCLDCGEPIKGRSDKKFCSDSCRNNYNNKEKSDSTNYMRNVNNILRKNRKVLYELIPNNKSKVHKSKVAAKGYNFNYHTNTYTTKKGVTYYFCYDYGFFPIENDYLVLVPKEEYIE